MKVIRTIQLDSANRQAYFLRHHLLITDYFYTACQTENEALNIFIPLQEISYFYSILILLTLENEKFNGKVNI